MSPVLWPLVIKGLVLVLLVMTLLWVLHFQIKNAAIVDFGWAFNIALLGGFYAGFGEGWANRRVLAAILSMGWGLRLAYHILTDRVIGAAEDPRYQALRQSWKAHLNLKLFLFFEFQALLDLALSVPFLLMALNPSPSWHPLEILGLLLALVSVAGEALADAQLKAFKRNPLNRGKTMRAGLWRYSRHPNYFFEWLTWVAFFLAALPSPYGVWTIIAPITMLWFLFKVTGIPLTEEQALKSRGEEYRHYQRTTSAFFPWFPKESR